METVPGQQAVAEGALGALRLQELQKNQAPAAANFQHLRIDFQAVDFHDGETAGNNLVEVGSYCCGILAAAAAAAVDGVDGMQRRLRPLRRSKQIKKKRKDRVVLAVGVDNSELPASYENTSLSQIAS